LESVRDVEQRIERAGWEGELQGWRPTLNKPNTSRPPEWSSAKYRRPHATDA
jgi:hypothetical protein